MEQNKAITVYCASSPDAPEVFLNAAYELGRELARAGFGSVTGAGRTGLMGQVVRGSLEAGGEAIGVIPQFMVDRGWANPQMTRLHVTADMAERKKLLADLGAGAIFPPGASCISLLVINILPSSAIWGSISLVSKKCPKWLVWKTTSKPSSVNPVCVPLIPALQSSAYTVP